MTMRSFRSSTDRGHPVRPLAITLGIALSFALSLALATGCGGDERSEELEPVSAARVEQETREALEAAADYGRSQKRLLEQNAERAVDQLEAEIEEIRGELARLPAESRDALERTLERAERVKRDLEAETDQMLESTERSWAKSRQRLLDAVDEAREARREIARALEGRGEERG